MDFLRTRLEEDSRAAQDENELSDGVDAWFYSAYVSLQRRSADIERSLAVSKVTLGPAILRGPRISRRLILPHPLSRQAAASKIYTTTMKPFPPLTL